MRTLPLATASRMGLPIALMLAVACAEDPVETPNAGLLTDYATGVDASFGVQTFALGPTLGISTPTDFQVFTIKPNGTTDISVQFSVKDFKLGKVRCYLNGKLNGAATKAPYIFKAVPKGLHTLGCKLATDSNQEQSNPEARAVVRVKVVPTCQFPNECDDGLACSQNNCVDGKCKYEAKANCCGSPFDCNAGDTCLNPNSDKSQCTACTKDLDCDDKETCTTDKCDLTGPKGVCKHTKDDPQCCSQKGVGLCDDGKTCTVDACDLGTGKCTHKKPDGVCCTSAECSSSDICLVGSCVDNECRFGPDKFKPDCCSDTTNKDCNDKYYCNIDKCEKVMPGGWKQCTHVKDDSKKGPNGEPCCDPLNQTDECDDENSCTWDICTNYQCENKIVAECCKPKTEAIDKICDDLSPCTLDLCEPKGDGSDTGLCKHKKIAGCCTQLSDCNDSLFCTKDTCNVATLSCVYKKDNDKCCDQNKECQDGKTCTTGYCVNHGCYFGPDPNKPASCCDDNGDCNDSNACTVDSCNQDVNTCVFTANGIKGCCNAPSDCDDNDCTTTDFCDAANQCAFKKAPYACTQAIDCDDGKPCTKDICDASGGCGVCKNEPDASCCELDGQCGDGKACTTDKCVNNKCDNSGKVANCCTNNLDAPVSCDDNNKCTIEYCLNNQCRHTVPKKGCCVGDSNCNDGDKCTTDKCELNGGKDGVCSFTKKTGCISCTPLNAASNCDDNNSCTVEGCDNDACTHTPKKDCCLDQFDCDDKNPCTYDGCVFNQCWHSDNAGSEKLCCKVETEAIDCADKNSQCGVGKCRQQPDSKWLCVAEAKPVCTFDIGYCQAFEDGGSLPLMGWNPANIKGTAGSNWGIDVDAGLGPDQHARLTWTPIKVNYDTCLTSPVFQAAGEQTITLQFDREFIKNVGTTNVRVLGSLDGENADWTKGVVIDTWNTGKSIGAETVDVKLPPLLSGSNGLRLAFCVSGASTFDLTKVGVDNFCIAKGSAPSFTACPPNHAAEMGFKKKIPIKAKDADLNDVISFSLVKAPSFVTMSTALYYWLDSSWNATLSVFATSKDDIGEHEVTIKVSDGKLYKLCTFRLTILYKGGVLIWRPTKVPKVHAVPVVSAIKGATGKIYQVIDDISLYPDLKPFDAVFVLLGVYPDNHVLTNSEIKGLTLYLTTSGKGRLYMEGGDTWAFDKATTLHPFFKVTGVLDSAPNGVTGPLTGNSVYNDKNNPTKIFNWGYSQSFAYNNLNDQIAGQTQVKRTGNLLRNSGIEKFWAHVGHDNKSAAYRTIGSSVLFGGVTNGDDTPLTLMKRIFNFFDNGFPDCKDDKGCDDGDACTVDKCKAGGDCSHTNNCLCSSETQLKCDAAPKKLVTNSGASTQTVEKYPCDLSGTKYDGKEISYGFVSADSRPVQVKYTNVNNANARVFVLKATDKGCDPTGCVATSAIKSGSATLNFAAAAGVQYHLVMDVPGAKNSAQFDMAISCAEGEICDDGKDNNLNGMTDCYDLKSCCGDKACPEVCDGLDNDCKNGIDEGCDDDGDLYCDVTMKVMKGAKCTNSKVPTEAFKQVQGDDCTDDDGTVNPGANEICKNGKDDNCSGEEDEIDAIGCVKYFTDLDFDDYGTGQPKCLCAPSGSYKATVGGDCQDGSKDINPGVTEKCVTVNTDDNCNGSINDVNADGCKNFYTDLDSDTWGTMPFKCMCTAEGSFKAPKPGDCDDAVALVNPAAPEVCNNIDDNCDGAVDEGCDDDGDDYCDSDFEYDPKAEPIKVCPLGAGDTDDEDPKINPAGQEICDDKDNDSDGSVDEDCNKDSDTYCDAKIVTVGKPKVCVSGGGDCVDNNSKVHPGMKETCDTSYDDNCNKTANDINATNCTPYFFDGDSDKWGTSSHQCLCVPKDSFKAVNPGDCKDADPKINPGVPELCDDIDNDCDGVVDNGCDEDKDGYCNSLKTLVGSPKVCPSGKGDCDDSDGNVNPAKAEVCGNGKDDNCNGTQNDLGAVGCNNFWPDGDDDAFGDASVSGQCLCEAKGGVKATNNGDCNDKDANINPVVAEKCDNYDNDCDGKTDEGCDDDKDGYCDAVMETVGSPTICPKGAGDCNDEDPNVFKGKGSEICDGKDDDCNGVADNGCDKDQDGFCDGAMIVAVPPPPACVKGGGDCDDLNYDANPAATEVCNNSIDDNCNGSTNDEKAVGCSNFYFDGDGDKYGLNLSKCLCTGAGAYTAAKGGDCADNNAKINPVATEICDGADNNCNGVADEAGATGCKDAWFDNDGDGYGLNLKKCLCGGVKPYTALKAGDCNDENKAVNPGVTEVCDDADNNCDSQVDEKCNQDGDKFCTKKMTVVGSPAACVLGGGDCDDLDANVHPAGNEICNDKDDNCDGKVDIGCDDDGDGFCDANLGLAGSSDKQHLTANFNSGVPGGWTSSPAAKTTSCGSYGAILGGYNVFGGGAWAEIKLSNLGIHKSLKVEFDFIKIDSWDGESGQLLVDGKQAWSKSYVYTQGKQECGVGGGWNELNDKITAIVVHTGNTATLRFTSSLNQAAGDESWGIDNVVVTALGSLPKICVNGGGDCNDNVKAINPGAQELCGNTVDENCSGDANDDGAKGCTVFYKDLDGDNYGPDANAKKCLCKADGVYAGTKSGDCDDGNNLVNGGATEICDGVDNNCDGKIDEGCDNDNDGYCDSKLTTIGKPPVCPSGGGDCNDDNDAKGVINPGAQELCGNNVDENCDGSLNSNAAGNCTTYYYDGDGDGYGVNVKQCLCTPENGFTASKAGDCDDSDKVINPDATEVCGNGKDDNCNGTSNEKDAKGCSTFYKDADSDGYGANAGQCQCTAEGAYITKTTGDCDDSDKNTHPGAAEICDGKDNSCKGTKDQGCDDDQDGYCDINMTVIKGALCLKSVPVCEGVIYNSKCYQAYPVAKTRANAQAACKTIGGTLIGIENQDENVVAEKARQKGCGSASALIGLSDVASEGKWVWDNGGPFNYSNWNAGEPNNSGDEDAVQIIQGGKWNDISVNTSQCYICELGKVNIGGGDDCNDNDKTVNPGVVETCDDKDNNCNGKADEQCDDDKDGYCNKARVVVGSPNICSKGGGDCDDSNNLIYPGKVELCDDNDNDCNGKVDEGCDDDGDDYCDSKMSTIEGPKACPKGGGDCDDTKKIVNPGASETCDGIDNNCAAGIDEVCNDEDGDGYCKGNVPADSGCPKGGGDCDDSNKGVNPGALENCFTDTDDNCNKKLNEVDALNCKNFYNDNDGDNYGAKSKCDGTLISGGFCLKGHKKSTLWADAEQTCSNWGGHLASIGSAKENTQLMGVAKNVCGAQDFWIGMHDKPGGLDKPVTFTNCNKTGRFGPSQGECDNSYANTPLSGKVTVAGGVQKFKVPVDGVYIIEAFGARGYNGGNGARMKGTFNLKAGTVLEIVAGQMGIRGGGGNGGGGGGSFIYSGNTLYMAAGGGGGQSPGYAGTTSNNGTNGGNGSGGSNGNAGSGTYYDGSGPGAGWNGGDNLNNPSNAIGANSRPTWEGGKSVRHNYKSHGGFGGGGFSIHPAGGGGYSGGGAGGGGGGSYNAGSNQNNTSGAHNTHGKVIITSPKANLNNEQEWVDKTPISYTNWAAGQPDNGSKGSSGLGTQASPALSCKDLLNQKPGTKTGSYWVKSKTMSKALKVYCDMTADGGGYTFYPISSGINTRRSTDNNSCKQLGMDIVYPRSKAHWTAMLSKYGNSYFKTIPGVTKASNGGNYTNCPMRSPQHYGSGCSSWGVPDGGKWWLRDSNYSEPNGDYSANCWLNQYDWNVNNIRFNDNNCNYSTSRYICSTNDKDSAKGFDVAVAGQTQASDGKWDDIAASSQLSCFVCKRVPKKCTPDSGGDSPSFVGSVRNINTRSHGGGFAPFYNEYWYPQWSGQTIYRYDGTSYGYKGAFNSGQYCMMQLWGEKDGTYVTANWGYNSITRKQAYSSSTLWNRNIGSTAGAVTSDDNYVYGMRYYNRVVYKLNKSNGQIVSTMSLSSGYVTTTYGGLAAVNGKFWRGNYNRRVDRFDISSGQFDGKTFYTAPYIYNMSFTGKEYCVSQNNSSVYCYTMFIKGDCTMGDDCNDFDKTIFPSKDETICDDKDNNCNGVIDDGCDQDGDGYCDVKKTTFGAPKICTSGGGDCNDKVKIINPGAPEVCANGIDDNCNTIQDEENAQGCTGWYYDGDQDGYGLANNYRCLCKGDGLYSTKKVGDCDDKCQACYPNAPEVCDGKNNQCGTTLLSSISQTATLTFNTRSHGGGFNPVFNEFWYPQWSGSTVYRYSNQQGNAELGTFSSGQSSIMQLWAAADEGGDYYTANWGYNTINKWKSKSNKGVWSFNIGGTAGGVTSDNQFVYAMRNSGATVWKLERATGKENAKFNLTGGSVSSIHGSLVALSGKLYRGNSNGTVYRYALTGGAYDGLNWATPINTDPTSGAKYPTYIYNTSFDNDSYCISDNTSNLVCFRLTQPGSVIDKDCDKDGDGYCDKKMTTIGTPPACPKGGLDCDDAKKSIYPGAPEQCNKSDDNCNGVVDEGASDTCNKEIYQAQATCDKNKGQCVILKCSDTFFNANGLVSDGCECSGNDSWEPNNKCSASVEVSKNVHDGYDGSSFTLMGKVVQAPDEDWYKFYAVDQKDSGSGVCDRFNVRVRFLQNPGGLAFEVHRGSCPTSKSAVCCGQTDFNWFTNFKGYKKNIFSSHDSEWGECPCSTETASNNTWSTRVGYNQRPAQGGPYCKKWTNGKCIPRGYDITKCSDDSSWFYVRVYKKSGGPSCTPYQLEISNGLYGSPGTTGYAITSSNPGDTNIGTEQLTAAKSCKEIKTKNPAASSGIYWLNTGSTAYQIYCEMAVNGGGWTTLMKTDGNSTTFNYDSGYWTNTSTYNAGSLKFDFSQAKFKSYNEMPFTEVMLGMFSNKELRWVKFKKTGTSMRQVMGGGFQGTSLGRNAWKSLLNNSSLQNNCNREGFNNYTSGARVRIGIIANQENNCGSPDSRLGFGGRGSACGQDNNNTCGNTATCSPDNGTKNTKAFGYIMAR